MKSVYVAMSGGVDSSVSAALLKKQGFNVTGIFMKPWQTPGTKCLWQKDREDAMRVASILKIPFFTWDFSREYGKRVAQYMIDSYRNGITPNPDVMCNKEIKFGLFLKRALKEGANYVATGHYARIAKIKSGHALKIAKDSNKDQTYFLWTLESKELAKVLFPVGNYTKLQVRHLAKKFKLPVHNKKDSQGVCFIGELDMKSFLKQRIKPKPGDILHVNGQKLGQHDGIFYYTIGQRHGLNIILGGGPYYVINKDLTNNVLVVGSERDLARTKAEIKSIRFTKEIDLPARVDVKIRYRSPSQKAILQKDGKLSFMKPQRAITPGQSAVFYRGQLLLGGGIIK